jgi:hypothetical protein
MAIESGIGDALEKPGEGETGIEAASAFKEFLGLFGVVEIVQLDEAEFEMGLGVFRHLENFLAAELAVERVLGGASFLAGGEAEMMDNESGVAELATMTKDFRPDTFMDAADEANIGIATEEANVPQDIAERRAGANRWAWRRGPRGDRSS